jgi:hypothetical protein
MHPDVGVCSIRYDELIAVLLLRQQRGHAVQPGAGLVKWTTNFGSALAGFRMANLCLGTLALLLCGAAA